MAGTEQQAPTVRCHGTWSHEEVEMEIVEDDHEPVNVQCPECGVVVRVA